MQKYTQHDLVTLYLAENGDWLKGYQLKGVPFKSTFIGSEADTRLYELFDKCVTDKDIKETHRKIDGTTYTIQTKKEGNRRVYRAFISKPKPKYEYELTPEGNMRQIIVIPCRNDEETPNTQETAKLFA